jgi:hypothetical protein
LVVLIAGALPACTCNHAGQKGPGPGGGDAGVPGGDGGMTPTPPAMGMWQAPDCNGTCTFPGDGAPPCQQQNIAPQIYYPPDGVLMPPNTRKMAVHWTPFPGGPPTLPIQTFEVAFKSPNTDVRVLTKCATQLVDTDGANTGGCSLELSQTMPTPVWDALSAANHGGPPVQISVRATTDGVCATSSTNTRSISFAEEDVNGGIFYWKSTVSANGVGGQIFAETFGSTLPPDQITGQNNLTFNNQSCFGCHTLSRDGARMTVNFDDDDSDDEYGDTTHTLVDVANKKSIDGHAVLRGGYPPGFQAFNPDHTLYLSSNGLGQGTTNQFFIYEGTQGTGPATPAAVPNVGNAGQRPTMMDWSADGRSILFVMPDHVANWDGNNRLDDDHVFGGSLFTMSYDPMAKTFGTPTPLIQSKGENNVYPSYSPDGMFIAFTRIAQQTATGDCSAIPNANSQIATMSCPNDSFANPNSRVILMLNQASPMPIDAEKANGSPAAAAVPTSNSWPRWTPFIQTYKGQKLLWITFSSTRDYGLRVRNQTPQPKDYCYPADSPESPGTSHHNGFAATCIQPQIWMAAINLSAVELGGTDPSYPAFWLPFQDDTTHNHTAQWTQSVATQPPPDMGAGACIANGASCTTNPTGCCAGLVCTAQGVCGGGIG